MVSVYNSIKFDNLIKLIPNNRNSGCWVYSEYFYSLVTIILLKLEIKLFLFWYLQKQVSK